MKDSLTEDWADALDQFRLSEVKAACTELLGSRPKDTTNEQQVKAVILKHRATALANLPKQIKTTPETKERISGERAAEIVKEFGYNVKTFND